MDVIDPALHPNGGGAVHVEPSSVLFVSDISAIHDPPIGLLKPVAVDGIVLEERKIRKKIEAIVLRIGIGKEPSA